MQAGVCHALGGWHGLGHQALLPVFLWKSMSVVREGPRCNQPQGGRVGENQDVERGGQMILGPRTPVLLCCMPTHGVAASQARVITGGCQEGMVVMETICCISSPAC